MAKNIAKKSRNDSFPENPRPRNPSDEGSLFSACILQANGLQHHHLGVMAELCCTLHILIDLFTLRLPQVFLSGPDLNLTRLCELILFALNHTVTGPDGRLTHRWGWGDGGVGEVGGWDD